MDLERVGNGFWNERKLKVVSLLIFKEFFLVLVEILVRGFLVEKDVFKRDWVGIFWRRL